MGHLPRWRVPPSSTFHWREWDSEFLVYHEQSGDTHRLNPLGATTLRLLTARPFTEPDLVTFLSSEFPADPSQDFGRTIHDLLGQLSDLGLIDVIEDASEPDPSAAR